MMENVHRLILSNDDESLKEAVNILKQELENGDANKQEIYHLLAKCFALLNDQKNFDIYTKKMGYDPRVVDLYLLMLESRETHKKSSSIIPRMLLLTGIVTVFSFFKFSG